MRTNREGKLLQWIRFPDNVYDRIWSFVTSEELPKDGLRKRTTGFTVNNSYGFQPPTNVISSAATSPNENYGLYFSFHTVDSTSKVYAIFTLPNLKNFSGMSVDLLRFYWIDISGLNPLFHYT